jgi:hypothetical protein
MICKIGYKVRSLEYTHSKPNERIPIMVNGIILEKGNLSYTHLSYVFDAIKNAQLNYNWLITDCVCYPRTKRFEELFSQEYCWLSGEELTKIIDEEDFQFIWADLCGFDKTIVLEKVLSYPLPLSDEYEGFWKNPVSRQHPLATMEIVPWDSSLVLVISKEEKILSDFKKYFPICEDLVSYNSR